MSKDENKDIETVYPWGKKTATYKAVLAILAFNVVALSIVFLAFVEVPVLQGGEGLLGNEPVKLGEIVVIWWWVCIGIIAFNVIITWVLIRVGRWFWYYEHHCHWWGCHTWIVFAWIVWFITLVNVVITMSVIWYCWFGWRPT